MIEYKHYNDYPMEKWRWKNFKPREIRSKGDDKLMIDERSMDMLQRLRDLIGKPFSITSAYRSVAHNKTVGGAKMSKHMEAIAFDIQMAGHDPAQFEAAAREVGFKGFGFYETSGFMHIDTRERRATWGGRWFEKATHWAGPVPQADMAQMDEPDDAPTSIWQYIINIIMGMFKK